MKCVRGALPIAGHACTPAVETRLVSVPLRPMIRVACALLMLVAAVSAAADPPACLPDCRGAALFDAALAGEDLSGANFVGATLIVADLTGANLSGADLTAAILVGVDLHAADLTGVSMVGAFVAAANLSGADLSGANPRSHP